MAPRTDVWPLGWGRESESTTEPGLRGLGRRCVSHLAALVFVGSTVGCAGAVTVPAAPVPTVRMPSTTVAPPTERAEATWATLAPVAEAATATSTPVAARSPEPAPTEEERTVTFTIVYDNNHHPSEQETGLRTAWGFACWVETKEMTVLFDSGGDGATLMGNLRELDLDPLSIDAVVLSHAHGDHTGGLAAILDQGVTPVVYVPSSFAPSFKNQLRQRTELVEVTGPRPVGPGMWTTGEAGTGIVEQALAVEAADGLVVVTGCAHPGVEAMVEKALDGGGGPVALVLGGYHLGAASRRRVQGIIDAFRELGVRRVAPCHCTGDEARAAFAEAFGEDCVLAGVGWSTQFVMDGTD